MDVLVWLIVANVIVNGIIAGLSFDVALVKLPTRKRIGSVAYANFARGNDLGNGVIVYPIVGGLTVVLMLAAVITGFVTKAPSGVMTPLLLVAAGTVLHSLVTAIKAAPIMLSLRHTPDDDKLLTKKLDQFAFWHTWRAVLQFLTFVATIWALVRVVQWPMA